MLRPVLFLHRWLGIAVGFLMTIWCLSGFVMMYVDYPRLLPTEQLQGLEPLQLPDTARLQHIDLPPDQALSRASIEMMAGRPVLRITPAMDSGGSIEQMRITANRFNLLTGAAFQRVPDHDLQKVATNFGQYSAISGGLAGLKEMPVDQWTVQTFRSNAPLSRAHSPVGHGTSTPLANGAASYAQRRTSRPLARKELSGLF